MINASRVKALFDGAAQSTLKISAVVSATTTETAITLNRLWQAYWNNFDQSGGVVKLAVDVTAIKTSVGDETYTFSLVADDVLALSHLPVVVLSASLKTIGYYEFAFDGKTLENMGLSHLTSGDAYIAARMTVAGTAPTITYSAWIFESVSA